MNNFSPKYCIGYTYTKSVSIISLEFKFNWALVFYLATIFGEKLALHTVGLGPPLNSLCLETVPWNKHMVSGRKTLEQLGKNKMPALSTRAALPSQAASG